MPAKKICDTCCYFVERFNDAETGECRYNPPVVVDAMIDKSKYVPAKDDICDVIEAATFFPITYYEFWCGKWEGKPESID